MRHVQNCRLIERVQSFSPTFVDRLPVILLLARLSRILLANAPAHIARRMLAVAQPLPHQLNGQSSAEDSSSFRPLKDIDAFKQHLPPPIEFVQGSSTGAVAVPSDKYECINDTPSPDKPGASPEKVREELIIVALTPQSNPLH